jgi:hypothetical protein
VPVIFSSIEPGVFNLEAIAAMGEAFDAALKDLQDTGQPDVVLEIIAQRIVAAATLGERDHYACGKLRSLGLLANPNETNLRMRSPRWLARVHHWRPGQGCRSQACGGEPIQAGRARGRQSLQGRKRRRSQ